ncbi:MAG TPA: hypothetical protein VHE13_04195 [Opitutus sp.]|nr:hypothetical protein [Opitutus sp.]
MKSIPRVSAALVPLALAITFLATEPGCATPEKAEAKKKADADDPWVTLPPKLGSNVPRRVRRSQLTAEEAASVTPTENVSGEAFMRNVRPQGPPPGAKGN